MPFLRTTRQMTDDPKLERIDCLLGVGTQVRGDLIFSGGLRIDGQVDGDVTVSCTDAGTLTIGDQGRVAGEVRVSHRVVYGCIEGPVHASGLVELRAGARIRGDVHYGAIEMHQGAVIEGHMIRCVGRASGWQ